MHIIHLWGAIMISWTFLFVCFPCLNPYRNCLVKDLKGNILGWISSHPGLGFQLFHLGFFQRPCACDAHPTPTHPPGRLSHTEYRGQLWLLLFIFCSFLNQNRVITFCYLLVCWIYHLSIFKAFQFGWSWILKCFEENIYMHYGLL